MERPSVSIGIPVYNGEAFLEEALESILAQTYRDFEVIISDNASTDRTEAICRAYSERDPRVRYMRRPSNLGAAENYNGVFREARGRYFKWASHDDVCAPDLLERCVAVLDKDPGIVLCYPSTVIIDAEGRRLGDYGGEEAYQDPKASDRYRSWMFDREGGECNAVFGVIRSDVLQQTPLIGKYMASDVILLSELVLRGRIHKLADRSFFRRDHPSTSGRANRNPAQVLAWFDTAKQGRRHAPVWRWATEHTKILLRVPLGFTERVICLGFLARWLIMIRRQLNREFIEATRGAFRHGAGLRFP